MRGNKKKKGKDNDNSEGAATKDTELPDDFSIFNGGNSVASSNLGGFGDDGSLADDYRDGDADEDAEDAHVTRAAKLADQLSLAWTYTSEKRSAKRESGYRILFQAITQLAAGPGGQEVLESQWGSVWDACLSSLTGRGNVKPSEQYAACRVLEASSVVLGADRDDVVEALNGPLKRIVNATGRATQVRAAALRCLAMAHFVCGTSCLEDGEDCDAVMALCAKAGHDSYRGELVNPLLRATALECWSLLSTTFHDAQVAGGDGGDDDAEAGRGLPLLPLLATCLDSPDAGLRRSAGECVAVIHEGRLNLGLEDEEIYSTTERRYRRGSWEGSDCEVLMDEVKQRVAELAVESSHHMSKQAKKQQRATFRDFATTVVDDAAPEEAVHWRGGKLTLRTWREIVQLNFVRHCLQGGFQIQLMHNAALHGIFGATFAASGTALSQLEKRLYLSKTSDAAKAADRAMTKQRRTRTNVKNHFLTTDGEDI